MKPGVKETIVVEGKYDKITLSGVIDANIIPVSGFSVFNSKETVNLIRVCAEKNGIVILTDSDGAGLVIRNYLKSCIPSDRIKNAYTPEIKGKERRKSSPSKEGNLGVEGMNGDIILAALRRAGVTFTDSADERRAGGMTKTDFYRYGLTGRENSATLRDALLKRLSFPKHLSANALLEAVNIIFDKADFENFLENIKKDISVDTDAAAR